MLFSQVQLQLEAGSTMVLAPTLIIGARRVAYGVFINSEIEPVVAWLGYEMERKLWATLGASLLDWTPRTSASSAWADAEEAARSFLSRYCDAIDYRLVLDIDGQQSFPTGVNGKIVVKGDACA